MSVEKSLDVAQRWHVYFWKAVCRAPAPKLRWRWEFKTLSSTLTRVTETYDYRNTGLVKDRLRLYERTGFGKIVPPALKRRWPNFAAATFTGKRLRRGRARISTRSDAASGPVEHERVC